MTVMTSHNNTSGYGCSKNIENCFKIYQKLKFSRVCLSFSNSETGQFVKTPYCARRTSNFFTQVGAWFEADTFRLCVEEKLVKIKILRRKNKCVYPFRTHCMYCDFNL